MKKKKILIITIILNDTTWGVLRRRRRPRVLEEDWLLTFPLLPWSFSGFRRHLFLPFPNEQKESTRDCRGREEEDDEEEGLNIRSTLVLWSKESVRRRRRGLASLGKEESKRENEIHRRRRVEKPPHCHTHHFVYAYVTIKKRRRSRSGCCLIVCVCVCLRIQSQDYDRALKVYLSYGY